MPTPQSEDNKQNQGSPKKPGVWAIIMSTLAAAIGVQSDKNRERDFQHGSFYPFIIAGIIFTVLFVLGAVLLVNIVLAN